MDNFRNIEAYTSGVSWSAVIVGAFVTAALWLILLALGAGIGLSAISPWSNTGAAAPTIGRIGIIWLIIVQIIASSMGGYLAERLRTKWATIHTDEVYFRDTAHGFLAWAVGLVISAAFLVSAATSLAGGAEQSGRMAFPTANAAATTSALPAGGLNLNLNDYYIDRLFRTAHPGSEANDARAHAEAAGIFTHALEQKNLSAADQTYLAELVAARTGLSAAASERRVAEVYADMQQAADSIRKATAHLSLWLFVAFLIGALCASYAATIGGRQRDRVALINDSARVRH
ncbi:MAG: hypothetical protein JO189_31725 [Deltaproteobacteria bacterium]|nr:hypothetical protein [Deltaproteobacteria bacterium]